MKFCAACRMDTFKIVLTILLGIIVSKIQCVSQNLTEEFDLKDDTIESTTKLELRKPVQYTEENEKINIPIHQMKKRIRIKTKIPPDYLTPPRKGNYGIFHKLNPSKQQVVQIHHSHPERFSRQQKQPILKNSNAEVPQNSDSTNQLFKQNLHQPSLPKEAIAENLNQNDEKLFSNVFVNQVQESSSPKEIVLKKVPQVQLISEMGSSTIGTSNLSDKDADLLKLIAQIKLATAKEETERNPKYIEEKKIQIGFKIPMPLATSLLGSAGILKGHLDHGKTNERLYYEPIPFFGKNNYPHDVPLELATQIKLQSDSYGPSFNPLYNEPYHGFLPVKLSKDSQYIEFPIEMYKTKFDPIPVSDNVYVNHQIGIGQKAGHIFPVKGSKSVFGYTRSSRFIGNIINH